MSVSRSLPSDVSPYWMESAFDIRQILKTLAKRSEKISVTVRAGPALGRSFVTIILDAGEAGDLVLDAPSDSALQAAACAGAEMHVHGMIDKIDIDFQLRAGKARQHDGEPALAFALPPRVHKLQRREYFRIPTPMIKPLACVLRVARPEDPAQTREVQALVLDLSLGGVCLQEPASLRLEPGMIFKGSSLVFPETGAIGFDLAIRHAFDIQNWGGRSIRRAGCEFLNFSSASELAVQRFMSKLERDRRATST